jgi:hypothetical protein
LECPIFGRDEDHLEETTNCKIQPTQKKNTKTQKQKGRGKNSYSKHMECPIFEEMKAIWRNNQP